jgi:hypothetical protein
MYLFLAAVALALAASGVVLILRRRKKQGPGIQSDDLDLDLTPERKPVPRFVFTGKALGRTDKQRQAIEQVLLSWNVEYAHIEEENHNPDPLLNGVAFFHATVQVRNRPSVAAIRVQLLKDDTVIFTELGGQEDLTDIGFLKFRGASKPQAGCNW